MISGWCQTVIPSVVRLGKVGLRFMQRSKSRTPHRVAFRRSLAKTCGMAVAILAAATAPASWTGVAAATAGAPYPASTAVPGISFDWGSYRRLAPGSDNWPLTWSADGNQYTSFGDGGGFGGSDVKGRVSLGFGRIEGTAESYRGRNLWGGVSAATSAKFTGKSYGVLAIGEVLYSWRCGAGSTDTAFDFQQIHRSENNGVTWRPASWQFPRSVPFYCPSFVQYGQGYQGARDGYVYMHASERDNEAWEVHTPGRLMLMRAPKDRLMDRAAYEFFAGQDASGRPRWSAMVDDRQAVFTDPNGARLPAVVYNAGLNRYLLTAEQAPKGSSNIGIFDAPEPWGPWTTVLYERGWGRGEIDTTAFYYNFSPKWWSNGGRDFVLVFTGSGQLDAWNSVQGSFTAGVGTSGGDGSGGGVATGTGAIPDGELASAAALATGVTTGSVASRGAVRSTAADIAAASASTDSSATANARSSRRTVRTATTGSGASSGVAGAAGTTSSIPRVVQPSVAGGRSTVTASNASESSTTRRRTRVDASSAAGTQSSSTTAGSVSATAGTRTNAATRSNSTATATSESGQQTRRIVTSSSRSAAGTRSATTATTAAAATGSRTTGASATATTSATAPTSATPSAARASPSATGSSTRARTGADPASETSSEVAGREEPDIDVDTGVGVSIPTPAPARSSRGAAPSVAAVAQPAAVAEAPARGASREVGRAAIVPDPAPVAETTVAAVDRATADPAVADLPAPVDGRSLEPRLVGIMERGALRTALVVPPGASQPTVVRTGDSLGSWSVEDVDGQEVALRSGEQTLVLRLFMAGG